MPTAFFRMPLQGFSLCIPVCAVPVSWLNTGAFMGNAVFEVIAMKDAPEKTSPIKEKSRRAEKPVSDIYPVIDNDLARDNIENDIPAADLEDL